MRTRLKNAVHLCLMLLFLLSATTTMAFAWENEQQALNNVREDNVKTAVLLQKLEKTADGEVTEKVVSGAVFRLYAEDGTLVGGPYATDVNGQIRVALSPGSYYYTETTPPQGYTYDWDEDGNAITQYAFTVKKTDVSLRLTVYNRPSADEPLAVALPGIIKKVEGRDVPQETFTFVLKGEAESPMPDGTKGTSWKVSRTGEGTVSLGNVFVDKPGSYTYTVFEEKGSDYNWKYDNAEYTLTIHVAEKAGKLVYDGYTLRKSGASAERLLFTNVYEKKDLSEKITVAGQKTWDHQDNPEENWPERIIVKVYGDGKLLQQRVVTGKNDWKYSFELPKYGENGKEIRYTIDEDPVEDYSRTVVGYDLVNTYVGEGALPAPDDPTAPDDSETKPSPGKPPKTGDEFALALWLPLGTVGLCGFVIVLVAFQKSRKRYHGRYLKNWKWVL